MEAGRSCKKEDILVRSCKSGCAKKAAVEKIHKEDKNEVTIIILTSENIDQLLPNQQQICNAQRTI